MKLFVRWSIMAAILASPYILVLLAGWWWLYERGYLVWWAVSATLLLFAGRWIVRWRIKSDDGASPAGLRPSPGWAPSGESAWRKVEELSKQLRHDNWPVDDPQRWSELFRRVLDTVAREYHPESHNPVLEITVPQIAKIVELVARDLGEAATEKVPGSHILTLNDLRKFHGIAGQGNSLYLFFYQVFRLARMSNPVTGLIGELRDYIVRGLVNTAFKPKEWALDFVVCKAGYYAIELYSGKLVVDDSYVTRQSRGDAARAADRNATAVAEPLRILLIGQVNAGKSSLINALFGDVKAAVDVVTTTQRVNEFAFEREGFGPALIFDTAGYSDAASTDDAFAELKAHLMACDLVLMACSATTAARNDDRRLLEQVHQRFQAEPRRQPPLIVVVLTHIDQLRPFAEWDPPYNVSHPTGDKARQIAEAACTVADELGVSRGRMVPVCLHPERLYNVEEGLLPALMEWLPEASRAKALRCLGAYRDDRYWRQLWRQTVNGGRLLAESAVSKVRR